MFGPQNRPIGLLDVVQAIRARIFWVAGWCLLVAIGTLAALFLLPRAFESEAKLFVRLGRESVTLDPTASTGAVMPIVESRESQINSTRDLLSSRPLYESVVDRLGPEYILNGPPSAKSGGLGSILANLKSKLPEVRIGPRVSQREKAVNELMKQIYISVGRTSCVLSVSSKAKTPAMAKEIMDAFLEAYQHQHWAANRTEGSFDFFAEQTLQLKQQLEYAQTRLSDAKNETSLVSIPVEQQALQTQLTQVESSRMDAAAALAASQAMMRSLKKAMDVLPEQVVMHSTAGQANAATDAMRQEFFKLQISNRELESRLGAQHPLVKTALAQTAELEKILEAQAKDRTETTVGLNTSKQTLELELYHEEAKVASYESKLTELDTQMVQLRERVRHLNESEVLIADLERELSLAAAKYQSFSDHLEQARVGEALARFRISNVNVVQEPSLCEMPVSPRPVVVLGLGGLLAVCGSVCLAIGLPLKNGASESLSEAHVGSNGNGALQIRNQRAEYANRGVSGGRLAASIDKP